MVKDIGNLSNERLRFEPNEWSDGRHRRNKMDDEQKQLLLNTLAQFVDIMNGYCKSNKGVLPDDLQTDEQFQLEIIDHSHSSTTTHWT